MTDLERIRLLALSKDTDLSRATQALHDAAVVYAATNATPVDAKFYAARLRLTRAAEDYAEAYLRG